MDFKVDKCRSREEFIAVIERYVEFYNRKRPCYSLGYDTPDNYYKRFRRGEIEKRDTFSKRELTEEPKFVRKKRAKAAETKQEQDVPTSVKSVSTSENENSKTNPTSQLSDLNSQLDNEFDLSDITHQPKELSREDIIAAAEAAAYES